YCEQDFVVGQLQPHLGPLGTHITAPILGKPGHKGGNVQLQRIRTAVLASFHDRDCFVTTLVDLYGLKGVWPGKERWRQHGGDLKAHCEADILAEARGALGEQFRGDRFIPYIQRHEYEALFFSDPRALALGLGLPDFEHAIRDVLKQFENPEAINQGESTHPKARVKSWLSDYDDRERTVASNIWQGLSLASVRAACPEFDRWMGTLERLGSQPRP
ncbi:MAG: DUF4276 family protein, partial [bacterium]